MVPSSLVRANARPPALLHWLRLRWCSPHHTPCMSSRCAGVGRCSPPPHSLHWLPWRGFCQKLALAWAADAFSWVDAGPPALLACAPQALARLDARAPALLASAPLPEVPHLAHFQRCQGHLARLLKGLCTCRVTPAEPAPGMPPWKARGKGGPPASLPRRGANGRRRRSRCFRRPHIEQNGSPRTFRKFVGLS